MPCNLSHLADRADWLGWHLGKAPPKEAFESGPGGHWLLIAPLLHFRGDRASARRDKPLLRLNCAAFSESLLESELFGHEKGAFSGAVATKPGLLETAHGGTVFLDEVGEL